MFPEVLGNCPVRSIHRSVFYGWFVVAVNAGEASQVDSKQKVKVTQKYNAKAHFLAPFHPQSTFKEQGLSRA